MPLGHETHVRASSRGGHDPGLAAFSLPRLFRKSVTTIADIAYFVTYEKQVRNLQLQGARLARRCEKEISSSENHL